MNRRIHLRVTGLVQGVWFRASTRDRALELGLCGWVKNNPDGSVAALAEGPVEALEALECWCHRGPPAAEVETVESRWDAATGEFKTFSVGY